MNAINPNAAAPVRVPQSYSAVLYRGPSMIDGSPVVAVATGLGRRRSQNSKTGPMVQLWIFADNGENPADAARSGADHAVCGDCPHRKAILGTCYVDLHKGARAAWAGIPRAADATKGGPERARMIALIGRARGLRLGAYGDPAAIPLGVVLPLIQAARKHTGYTHQWHDQRFECWRPYLMASVDTPLQRIKAVMQGWRTFRVSAQGDLGGLNGEILCPASDEAGWLTDCASCGLCAGASKVAKSVFIPAHGATAKRHIGA